MNYVSDNSNAANGFRLDRWHMPDPANQYASPYVGMGNNPATRVDPDGREDNASPMVRMYWRDFFDRRLSELQRSASIDNIVWGCGNYGAYEGTRHAEIKRWIEKHYQGSTGSGDLEEFLKRGNNWEKVSKLRIRNITLVDPSSIGNKQGNTTGYLGVHEGTEMMFYCDIEISNEYFKGNDRIGIGFQLTLAHELIHVADLQYNWDNLKQLDNYARDAIKEKRVANILNDSNVSGSYLPQSYKTKYESWENETDFDFNQQKNHIYKDHKDLISIFNKAYKYVWEGDNINAFDPFTIEWK